MRGFRGGGFEADGVVVLAENDFLAFQRFFEVALAAVSKFALNGDIHGVLAGGDDFDVALVGVHIEIAAGLHGESFGDGLFSEGIRRERRRDCGEESEAENGSDDFFHTVIDVP